MKEKISSMGIIIAENQGLKKVLLLNSEGEWVFPKGHAEKNETYIETVIREIKEETGIKLRQNQCLGEIDEFKFYFEGEKAVKVIKVFLFKINLFENINFNKEEGFTDGQWFDLREGIKTLQHDDARGALKKAINVLVNVSN